MTTETLVQIGQEGLLLVIILAAGPALAAFVASVIVSALAWVMDRTCNRMAMSTLPSAIRHRVDVRTRRLPSFVISLT